MPILLGMVACALVTPAHAARIDGLSPFEPMSAEEASLAVVNGAMHIDFPEGRKLTITPWPTFLPQRFGKQAVAGTRHMHPAGPSDRLTFKRAAQASPWMAIGSGARQSTSLIDQWQLQLSRGRWSVSDGKTRKFFGIEGAPPKPAMISIGADSWCIYLLESTMPAQQPQIAMEAEPNIGWAAIRLSRLQRKCSIQK